MASKREIDKENMFRKIMPSAAAAQPSGQTPPAKDGPPRHDGGTPGGDAALFAEPAPAVPEPPAGLCETTAEAAPPLASPVPGASCESPAEAAPPLASPVPGEPCESPAEAAPPAAPAEAYAPAPQPTPVPPAPAASLVLEPANEWAGAVQPGGAASHREAPPQTHAGAAAEAPAEAAAPALSSEAYQPAPQPPPAPLPYEAAPPQAAAAAAPAQPVPAVEPAAEPGDAGEDTPPFPVNLAEILVEHYYPIYQQRLDACPCPRCRDDACGMALNRIRPHYVVSSALTPEALRGRALVTETVTALVNAIFKVKRSPRHDVRDPMRL